MDSALSIESGVSSEPGSRPAASRRTTETVVKRLGDLRDGLLLLAGVLYLLGYISWAFYALETGIGLVPVLDSQYFAAGIVPASILMLFIFSVRLLRAFQKWLKRPLSTERPVLQKALSYSGFTLMLLFGVVSIFLSKSKWQTWLMFGCIILIVLASFFGRGREHRLMQLFGLVLIWSYTVLGALWLIFGYHGSIFPWLPSELGGPKPRCAQLDIDGSQLSPETRVQLLGSSLPGGNSSVFRSAPLYLIFDGSEYMLLSERSEPASRTNRVYRLRKDAVRAVFPCPRDETGGAPR